MMSIAQQLQAAGAQAAQLARAAQETAAHKTAWQAKARQKQWESRRTKGANALRSAIPGLLPTSREAALTLTEVKALFADRATQPTGVSSALTKLVEEGHISRTGEPRAYRYFNPHKEAA